MLSIPVKGGHDVKPFCIKRLEEAHRIIKTFEQAENDKAKEVKIEKTIDYYLSLACNMKVTPISEEDGGGARQPHPRQ